MSDEGETITCPLCAQEMDATEQQLKPCECGYEMCVFCWNQIMDESDSRCPACHSPYDEETTLKKYVDVDKIHMERKIKLIKKKKNSKAKLTDEQWKLQLSSNARVIQKNLVYVIGIPFNRTSVKRLKREFFGRYGKVDNVSIGRTYQDNTCSVFINYSKEEEAIRCIRNVDGQVLEGRSLRANFGTVKYCHKWLRNEPCKDRDCWHLHQKASEEDTIIKDAAIYKNIRAYTWSIIQQTTGGAAANNVPSRRSGNVLAPPFVSAPASNSSGKLMVKNVSSNGTGGSPAPNESAAGGCITALPSAAESSDMRSSTCQPLAEKQKPADTVAAASQSSVLHGDDGGKKQSLSEEAGNSIESVKAHGNMDFRNSTISSEKPIALDGGLSVNLSSTRISSPPTLLKDDDKAISMLPNVSDYNDTDGQSFTSSGHENDEMLSEDHITNLFSEMSSMRMDRNVMDEMLDILKRSKHANNHNITIRSMRN